MKLLTEADGRRRREFLSWGWLGSVNCCCWSCSCWRLDGITIFHILGSIPGGSEHPQVVWSSLLCFGPWTLGCCNMTLMSSQEVLNGFDSAKSIHSQTQSSRFPKQPLEKLHENAELIHSYDLLLLPYLQKIPLNIGISTAWNFLKCCGGHWALAVITTGAGANSNLCALFSCTRVKWWSCAQCWLAHGRGKSARTRQAESVGPLSTASPLLLVCS